MSTPDAIVQCHRLLLAAALTGVAVMAHAADRGTPSSDEKLRQILGRAQTQAQAQAQTQPTAAQAGNPAVLTAKTLSPERLQERADLLASGEQALARRNVDAALVAFDRAALILHAADTEIALVRAYMQGGEYRRALAFGAHTAGAHLDVVGGSALYAWLLNAGGQSAIARRLLTEAQARASMDGTAGKTADKATEQETEKAPHKASDKAPDRAPDKASNYARTARRDLPHSPVGRPSADILLNRVQQQMRSGTPLASGALLALPTRLAPYGSFEGLPKTARVVGSGLLLYSGQDALVPLALVPRSGAVWLRNGLGQLAPAHVTQRLPGVGVALLRLGRALPVAQDLAVAQREAFPGSVGYAIEFSPAPDATPAWPTLRTGFLGAMPDAGSDSGTSRTNHASAVRGTQALRLLGIDMANGTSSNSNGNSGGNASGNSGRNPRGGPVFDATGRLLGLALAGPLGTPDRLVTASALPAVWGVALAPRPAEDADTRYAMDRIFEISLKTALQVIAGP